MDCRVAGSARVRSEPPSSDKAIRGDPSGAGWDDGAGSLPHAMYTDWTAVILLLLTAAPLAVVVATAAFFIWRKKQKG